MKKLILLVIAIILLIVIIMPRSGVVVDIDCIIELESGSDPNAVDEKSGARGLCQITQKTWDECTIRLEKDWDWAEAFDPYYNKALGKYYINERIPQMLKHNQIPDTIETRLAAYKWDLGSVLKLYFRYGTRWQQHTPPEIQNYIKKYGEL
jgi:soluble lytic murein transglycosylase-like protein